MSKSDETDSEKQIDSELSLEELQKEVNDLKTRIEQEKNPEIRIQRERYWGFFSEGLKGTLSSIWNFIKYPKDSLKWLFRQKNFIVFIISIISGFVGAGAAWLFSNFIALIRILFFGVIYNNVPIYWKFIMLILIPTLAATLMSPLVHRFSPESKGHGIPEVMESIIYKDGYIKTSTPYIKMLSAGVNIGAGLSLGSEGPIAQTGAGLSSFLGRKLGLSGRNIKTVVVCGLVAGISATFNAPIGGVLFGIEVLIVSLNADQLIPVIISSLIATTIGRLVLERGSQPIFEIPEVLKEIQFRDYLPYLHWFILLGIVVGFAAILYVKSVGFIEKFVNEMKINPILAPILGALTTGFLGIVSPKATLDLEFTPIGEMNPLITIENVTEVPRIFGNGYDTITSLFYNFPNLESWDVFGSIFITLLAIALLKILATAFSVGSGNSGGVFAPALFSGAMIGFSFAVLINNSINGLGFSTQDFSLFTLVGLAALFAGSSRAILTMIFMASELTSSYHTFIPLMITCSISYFICKATMKDSIYTLKLRQKGLNITMAGPSELLHTMKVKDIMTSNVVCVPENMSMREFYTLVQTMEHFGYPIIDFQGKYVGMITGHHLKLAQLRNQMDKTVTENGELNTFIVYPEESVEQAMSLLYRSQIGRIAVLDSPENRNLIGIVSHTDLLRCLEIQKIKDIEERRLADLFIAKAELELVEEALEEYPELTQKVKVIQVDQKKGKWEKSLVEYLREKATNIPLETKNQEINTIKKKKKKQKPKKTISSKKNR